MELLTAELRAVLPPIYTAEKESDPTIHCKFFDPCGSWTWYVLEFDGEETFFGLVHGHEEELGYFSLSELEEYCGPFRLGIERDILFKPCPLSAVRTK